MKLINKTKWDTKDLRKLCNAVIKHTGSHKNHIIEIVTKKVKGYSSGYSGVARLNGDWICMRIPATVGVEKVPKTSKAIGDNGKQIFKLVGFENKIMPRKFNVDYFAKVLEHEIGHNLGLTHDVMIPHLKLNTDYVKDFKVNPKEIKQKPKRDLKQERFDHAKIKVKELQSKIKRNQNLLKKWQKRVKYYERETK